MSCRPASRWLCTTTDRWSKIPPSLAESISPVSLVVVAVVGGGSTTVWQAVALLSNCCWRAGIPWSADIVLNDTRVSDAGVYRCMVNNPPETADPGIGELELGVLGECRHWWVQPEGGRLHILLRRDDASCVSFTVFHQSKSDISNNVDKAECRYAVISIQRCESTQIVILENPVPRYLRVTFAFLGSVKTGCYIIFSLITSSKTFGFLLRPSVILDPHMKWTDHVTHSPRHDQQIVIAICLKNHLMRAKQTWAIFDVFFSFSKWTCTSFVFLFCFFAIWV